MRRELMAHLQRCNSGIMPPSAEAEEAYPQRYRERIEADWSLLLVAESGGALVGMGEIHLVEDRSLVPARTAKINDVWVDEAHRRRGLGRAVAQALLAFAHSRGIGTVWLDWVDGNREAEGLWRSLGFHPTVIKAVLRQSPPPAV